MENSINNQTHYWLQRISWCPLLSVPLLRKGYLATGWSDMCDEEDIVRKAKEDDKFLAKLFSDRWGSGKWGRYIGSLRRFFDMNVGDWVIVPSYGTFSVYEITGDARPVSEIKDDFITEDLNEKKVFIDGKFVYEEDATEKDDRKVVDIGFVRTVKLLFEDISRYDYAPADLTSRLKYMGTNCNIDDLKDSITTATTQFTKKMPINLYGQISEGCIDIIKSEISKMTNPDKFEKLVKWYFDKVGADIATILHKNPSDKIGTEDADVFAEFESIRTKIYVQVKQYQGKTGKNAVEQISQYKEKEKLSSHSDGYTIEYWVISMSDTFDDDAKMKAQDDNIILINGNEFAEMLLRAGFSQLENFDQ